ncbi:hypothetical protein M2109_005967 [Paenibacillus sp. PastH-3]|nr:hypothetical protein [Paenibacillus sp. PastH-4]MDH6447443.1 hypothetical protein [Paenibacillus sp. PastF-4]MDH6531571.1 hypothetical protein [Paenibacillus sp. PastH-3]
MGFRSLLSSDSLIRTASRGWNPRTKANAPLLQLQTFSPFHTFTSKQFRSTDSVPSQPTIETRIVQAGELHITDSPRLPPVARRLTRATNSQATRRFARAPQAARYLTRALNYTSNTTLRACPTLKPTKPKPKITNLPYAGAPYDRCPAYAGWTIPDENDQDG